LAKNQAEFQKNKKALQKYFKKSRLSASRRRRLWNGQGALTDKKITQSLSARG
jgi:hypothetical protein